MTHIQGPTFADMAQDLAFACGEIQQVTTDINELQNCTSSTQAQAILSDLEKLLYPSNPPSSVTSGAAWASFSAGLYNAIVQTAANLNGTSVNIDVNGNPIDPQPVDPNTGSPIGPFSSGNFVMNFNVGTGSYITAPFLSSADSTNLSQEIYVIMHRGGSGSFTTSTGLTVTVTDVGGVAKITISGSCSALASAYSETMAQAIAPLTNFLSNF